MKKCCLLLLALLVSAFVAEAQQWVSTSPSNRNVIVEEFTGRNCVNCPDGHAIANQIMENHPGHAWAINVHAGSYAPTTYPNLITPDSEAIREGFHAESFPTGIVNRSTAESQPRTVWTGLANEQLSTLSECNVAGRVLLNPETRLAEITVEVYYTGNSLSEENYLTVAMVQDSIMGSQTGSNYNPAQVIDGTYCHMHVLRDVINDNVWGDAIAPTTQGTLITKTYSYSIPQSIGDPNGVEVNLDHIHFLAWVSECFQGTPTRPILNACELELLFGTHEPIYPFISDVTMIGNNTCTQWKTMKVKVLNIGTETLTSMRVKTNLENDVQEISWEGTLLPHCFQFLELPMEVPFGVHTFYVEIVEANGEVATSSYSYPLSCLEWANLEIDGDTELLKLLLVQDKYGMQITWEVTSSTGEIFASGGPYTTLPGSTATMAHEEFVTVPVDECVMFTIRDSGEDGICCAHGNGYYQVFDSNGHLLVDGSGDFGKEAWNLISVNKSTGIQDDEQSLLHIFPNPTSDYLTVKGEMEVLEVYDALGQGVVSKVVDGDEAQIGLVGMSNGIYLLRIYNKGRWTVKKFTVCH